MDNHTDTAVVDDDEFVDLGEVSLQTEGSGNNMLESPQSTDLRD